MKEFKPFKAWYCNNEGIPELITINYIYSLTGIFFKDAEGAIRDYIYDLVHNGKEEELKGYKEKIEKWKIENRELINKPHNV